MRKSLLLFFYLMISLFLFPHISSAGENQRFIAVKDSTKSDIKAANREAKKALIFSAIVPGAGQAYNHKYWKIPLIYAAGGGFGYLLVQNHKLYKQYSNDLKIRYDGDSSTLTQFANLSDAQVITEKKLYKKRRDMCIIGVGAVYIINLVDAYVDGHLRKFDQQINENISLSIRPKAGVFTASGNQVYYSGLKLRLNF